MKIIIPGKPIAKKRPRFARRETKKGKDFVQTFNPQESEEGKFLTLAHNQIKGYRFHGPLYVDIWFFMPIPKSMPKYKLKKILSGSIDSYHTKKPDIDNMIKFVLDCFNGMIWGDDSQVVKVSSVKVYSPRPRTEIDIEEVRELIK